MKASQLEAEGLVRVLAVISRAGSSSLVYASLLLAHLVCSVP